MAMKQMAGKQQDNGCCVNVGQLFPMAMDVQAGGLPLLTGLSPWQV